jgi:hypothetical protein
MRRFLALAAVVTLSACSQEIDQSTRPENLVGGYTLVSYGGSQLPAVLRSDSVKVEVLSGQLILTADQGWSETLAIRTTFKGTSQTVESIGAGTWSNVRDFAYISFNDKVNGYAFSGMAAGRTVALNTVNGDQLIYRR